ncbi:MAG: monofunctional biosynthetic peptidoglycan transglycosylase [Gammaproteobacteria bacterium]|jgi:monofunctional biosynthetic peptidoglycan transglycosylase
MLWFNKNKEKKSSKLITLKRLKIAGRWGWRVLLALLFVEIGFIWGLMPDWDEFSQGPVPKSRAIKKYEYLHTIDPSKPPLRWNPVSLKTLPKHVSRAVVVAEDARFYQHKGLDQQAIEKAIEYNLSKGRIVYGASTISQQTIKNLFLTPSRNPLRKLHEVILTYMMEHNVGKKRILEIYLNIAEFGTGVYGVDAASRFYYGKPARFLSVAQSIELAATLPAPTRHNPRTRTQFFQKKVNKISRHMGYY